MSSSCTDTLFFMASICFIFPYLFLQQVSVLFFHISFYGKYLFCFSFYNNIVITIYFL